MKKNAKSTKTSKSAPRKAVRASKPPARKAPIRKRNMSPGAKGPVTILVGTLKGAFVLKSNEARSSWKLSGPVMLGQVVNHIVHDPRDRKVMLMAGKTGHLGPTIHRSTDGGKTWKEASKPPAFEKAPEGQKGKSVDSNFWLTPGHASEKGTWFLGTIPIGLFKSTDGGDTWDSVDGLTKHPDLGKEGFGEAAPGGPFTHSIIIDPRDARHMYLGISGGGVLETTDGGATWQHLNKGSTADFFPEPNREFGQDPHCIVMSPSDPDILWQQNHCGIYRMDRREGTWVRVGRNMPKSVGDIGFPICVHPRDPNTAWVFPMDGTTVWPRTSPDARPATYMTTDGGRSWKRQDGGFPKAHGYFTVFRQSMKNDTRAQVGLYLGTTNGEVWASRNGGGSWKCIARWLPRIISIHVVEGGR